MKYLAIRYVLTDRRDIMALRSFDATYREVVFRSNEDMTAARVEGRARIDCTAIVNGLLPRGAISVSRAIALEANDVLAELKFDEPAGRADPMAAIRLRFSQKLLVERSECITVSSDLLVRRDHPRRGELYDTLIADLARSRSPDRRI